MKKSYNKIPYNIELLDNVNDDSIIRYFEELDIEKEYVFIEIQYFIKLINSISFRYETIEKLFLTIVNKFDDNNFLLNTLINRTFLMEIIDNVDNVDNVDKYLTYEKSITDMIERKRNKYLINKIEKIKSKL
jgi:hypothetical protein